MARWIRDHRLVACLAVAALLYLPGLGRPPLWEPDEGRYAEIAREMVLSGDYVTPRDNFVRYFEKPPLLYWLTAASIRLLGANEFAVRLPSALASIGQAGVVAALGEVMFGPAAGVLAALALGLSPLFFGFARFATPDPLLAFFMAAAMAAFYMAVEAPQIGSGSGRLWMLTAVAGLALGTLTKGPVALVLGGAIGLIWLFVEQRWRDALRIRWLECAAVYLIIALPWFVMAARRNPGFTEFYLVHEHLHRYLANTEHEWGPWFFVPITIAGAWPWAYFAAFGLVKPASGDEKYERQRRAIDFLVIWFGVIFVFFSIPKSKLGEYILPAIPAVAILAGRGIARIVLMAARDRRRRLNIFVEINAAFAISMAIMVLVVAGRRLNTGLAVDSLAVAVVILIGAVFARGLSKSDGSGSIARLAVPLAIAMVLAMAVAMNARDSIAASVSRRALAHIIMPYISNRCILASYKHFEQSLPFYTGVPETLVDYRGELAPFGPQADPTGKVFATDQQLRQIWAATQCVVLVANRGDLATLDRVLAGQPSILGCEGKKLALYNRPLAHSGASDANCASDRGKKTQN